MIINFKLFEAKKKTPYWKMKIRSSDMSTQVLPNLEVGLDKVGMTPEEIEHWKYLLRHIPNSEILLFNYHPRERGANWCYTGYDWVKRDKFAMDDNFEYMGEVSFDKTEKEKYKELKQVKKDANRYNL